MKHGCKILFALFFLICNSVARCQTNVSGDQGDSTWTLAKSPYTIAANVLVPQGKTLTIEPGVVVQFPATIGANSELIVKGTLKAVGSPNDSITFLGGSIGGYCCGVVQRGPVIIDTPSNSSILQYIKVNALGYVPAYDNEVSVIIRSSSCIVSNCTIENISGSGLQLDGASPVINNNHFSANSNLDVLLDVDKLKRLVNNDSLKIGLASGFMTINDTLSGNNYYYRLLNTLIVPTGITLTIAPKVTLQFPSTTSANTQLIIKGTLKAIGTPTDSITFLGGTIGGYCCGTTQRGPVVIDTPSVNSILQYVIVNSLGYVGTSDYKAAVIVRSPSCTISNCTIENTYSSGLQLDNANPLITNNHFIANSNLDVLLDVDKLKRLINNDSLKIGLISDNMTTNDTLSGNNYYYRLLNSLVVPTGRTLTVSPKATVQFPSTTSANMQLIIKGTLKAIGTPTDSITFLGGTIGGYCCGTTQRGPVVIDTPSINSVLQYVSVNALGYVPSSDYAASIIVRSPSCTISNCAVENIYGSGIQLDTALAVANNNFSGNTNADIIGNATFFSQVLNNNNASVYITPSNVYLNSIWPNPGNNSRYVLDGTIKVNPSVTLNIPAGITVDFNNNNGNVVVDGSLIANGTSSSRIRFVKQSQSTPLGGTLSFGSTSSNSSLTYVTLNRLGSIISPSKSAAVELNTNSVTFANDSIVNSESSGIVIKKENAAISQTVFVNNKTGILSEAGKSVISHCSFDINAQFAINNVSTVLTDTVDGRYNWWGDSTGPKHPSNPQGKGDSVSDRVKFIPFNNSSSQNLIINPSAENPLSSEWNIVSSGTPCFGESGWRILGGQNNYPIAEDGSYIFNPGCGGITGNNYEIYQDVNISNNSAAIDAGEYESIFSCYLRSFNQSPADQATVMVECRDSSNTTVLSNYSTGATTNTIAWVLYSDTVIAPVKTRFVRVRLIATSRNASAIDSYFDNFSLTSLTNYAKQNQTINFNAIPDKTFGDSSFLLHATASSGLPVQFKIINGLAKIIKDTLTILGAGTIKVQASQSGDSLYYPASPVTNSFTVYKADQQITFNAILDTSSKTLQYILIANCSTGLPITFTVQSGYGTISGDTVTFTGAGNVIVRAEQSGNQNYNDAYKEITFCVTSSQPGAISGFTTSCIGTQTYSVPPLNGVTFTWSVSDGGNIPVPTGNSVKVNWTQLGAHTLTVTSSNNCDAIKLSQSISVTIINSSVPGSVSNLFPANGTVITNLPFSFSWQPAVNASLYDLYIWSAGSNEPTSPTIANINGIAYSISANQISGFAAGATFNWTVTAKNGCAETSGPVQKFIISSLPNLIVSSVNVPDSVFSGTDIDMSAIIENIGKADTRLSGQWVDEFWLSADSAIDAAFGNDIYLGSKTNISALNINQSYSTTLSVQLPKDKVGAYNIIVRTNHSQSVITESNPNDNTNLKQIYIKPSPTANLIVNSVLYRADAFSGDTININFNVENAGKIRTEDSTWRDDIYLSPNQTFDQNGAIKVGSITHYGSLNPGESYNATFNAIIPTRIYGTYYFYVYTDAGNKIYEYLYDDNNVTVGNAINIILTAPPDFIISQLTAPSTAVSGENISIDYSVLNQGANKPGKQETTWQDAIIFSTDSVFNQDSIIRVNTYTISNQQPTLLQGAFYNNTVSFTIPSGFSGKAYLYAYADYVNNVFENFNENNNYKGVPITILNPDLIVSNPNFSGEPLSGNAIDVYWTVKNSGNGRVLPVDRSDAVWLSPTSVFNPGNSNILQTVTYNAAMDTGSSIAQHATINLPQNIFGKYYLFIQTDYKNNISESNENNNLTDTLPITIIQSPPVDLAADTVQISSDTFNAGTIYTLHYSVTNKGVGSIIGQSWVDRIYRSTQPVLDNNAQSIIDIPQNKTLSPGESYDQVYSIVVNLSDFGNQDTLKWYYFVVVDAKNTISEYNAENNNTARSRQVIITHQPYPDLIVNSAIGSDSLNSGSRTEVSGTISNIGGTTGLSNSWYDAILFSKDTIPDGNDIVAATKVAITPFLYSNSYNVNFNFRVPDGLSGNYYMLLVADYADNNYDKNRSNNYKVVRIKIGNSDSTVTIPVHITLTPSPDLVVSSFNVPNVGFAGQPVWVKFTVTNKGKAPTNISSWKDAVYLSQDNSSNVGNIIQTYTRNGILDTGASYTDSVLAFLPSTAVGNYFIIFKADAYDAIYENGGEDNNAVSSVIFVEQAAPSDLVVDSVICPPQAFIGDSVTISWTVKNQGLNPATGYMWQGIYSSADSVFDSTEVLLATPFTQIHLSDPGDTIFTQKVKLDGVSPGANHILINTDLRDNIPEQNEENNISSSLKTINVSFRNLPIDTLTPAVLQNNTNLYYKIDIPDSLSGKTSRVSLKGDSVNATNELYIRYANTPSRITYDFAYSAAFSGSQDIIIPSLVTGTYYLLAYGSSSIHNSQAITLYATPVNFQITDVNANQGGNTGNVTVKIDGARFEDGMTAILKNKASGNITAQKIALINSISLFATFNLNKADTGLYNLLLVKSNNDTALLKNGFTIVPGTGGITSGGKSGNGFYCYIKNDEQDALSTQVDYPGRTRWGRPFPMTIIYGNSGNIDIPIPVIALNSLDKAPVGLTTQFIQGLISLPLEFVEPNGPKDVLRPGATGSITVFSALPSPFMPFHYQLIQY